MRSSFLVSALMVAGVMSTPVFNKRFVVTEVITKTVIDYITENPFVPTSTASTTVIADAAGDVVVLFHNSQTSTSTTKVSATTPTTTSVVVTPTSTTVAAIVAAAAASTSVQGAGNGPIPTSLSADSTLYQEIVLTHHNVHRSNHSASALTWNQTLADYAKAQAETCVYSETLPAGQPGGWGQNIAAGAQVTNVSAVITDQFYNSEMPLYPGYGVDSPDMSNFQNWGHFSQVVWQGSQSVGCYSYTCHDNNDCQPNGEPYLANTPCGDGGVPGIYHVCNYYPPGNYAGEYTQVGAPLGDPDVDVNQNGVSGL